MQSSGDPAAPQPLGTRRDGSVLAAGSCGSLEARHAQFDGCDGAGAQDCWLPLDSSHGYTHVGPGVPRSWVQIIGRRSTQASWHTPAAADPGGAEVAPREEGYPRLSFPRGVGALVRKQSLLKAAQGVDGLGVAIFSAQCLCHLIEAAAKRHEYHTRLSGPEGTLTLSEADHPWSLSLLESQFLHL